jgi:hypothetical protein
MQADFHFVVGRAHIKSGKPCQDYAAAAQLDAGRAYAIVSDGCSSAGRTDIGARLLTLATARAFNRFNGGPEHLAELVAWQQTETLAATKLWLGLDDTDMLATCVYAWLSNQQVQIRIMGDGMAAWLLDNGTIQILRVDWANNHPAYPAYAANGFADFLEYHRRQGLKHPVTVEHWSLFPDGTSLLVGVETPELAQAVSGTNFGLEQPAQAIAVFTDGVNQVEGMDWRDVVRQLLSFKTTQGEFAKRRLNRLLRDGLGTGHLPIDDLACAVILMY